MLEAFLLSGSLWGANSQEANGSGRRGCPYCSNLETFVPSRLYMSGEELLGEGSGALDPALGSSCSVEGA